MWKLNVVLECLLVSALLWRRTSWPWLTYYLAGLCVRDVIGWYAYAGHPLLYWWNYYMGSALVDVLQVGLMVEIACKLCPLPAIAGELRRYIPRVAIALASLTAVFPVAGRIPQHLHPAIVFLCRRIDVAVSVGCASSLLLLCILALTFRIQFSHGTRAIVLGFLSETVGAYLLDLAVTFDAPGVNLFTEVKSLQYLFTLACFAAPALSARGRVRNLPKSMNKTGVRANAT